MCATKDLQRGREALGRKAWNAAYASLLAADNEEPLEAEDLENLAVAAHLSGKYVESDEILTRAHHRYLSEQKPERAARCAVWLVFSLHYKGDLAQAGGWLARAQRLLSESGRDCAEQGYALIPTGFFALREGDLAAAYTSFTHAAETGQRFKDTDLVTLARQGQGRVLIQRGEIARGVSLLDEAMVAVTAGEVSPIVAGSVYCSVIEACSQIFDLRRAQEWTSSMERWCASQPDLAPYRGHCLLRRAEILQLHGAWQEALDEALRVSELQSQSDAIYQTAEVYRLRGDFTAAEEAYRRAGQLASRPRPGLALLRLAQGQIEAAAATIRLLKDQVRDGAGRPPVLDAYVEIMLAANDAGAARTAADELAGMAARLQAPLLRALSDRASGAVLLAENDFRGALERLRRALDGWRELNAPYETARTRVLIAQACRRLGDCDSADLELEAACGAFRHLGATPDAARYSNRAESETPLSERELQVLRLVAAGLTNREIAARLHISEKTVARHMSNIFTKLDLPSRAAATAYAYEHGLVGSTTT
jgi:ATP/maltotriose-dependent transcriptional regulator MalT